MQMQGTVKWFNATKGFGFIKPDDNGKDVFVHGSALKRAGMTDLPDGTRIKFDEVKSDKGRSAENISVIL